MAFLREMTQSRRWPTRLLPLTLLATLSVAEVACGAVARNGRSGGSGGDDAVGGQMAGSGGATVGDASTGGPGAGGGAGGTSGGSGGEAGRVDAAEGGSGGGPVDAEVPRDHAAPPDTAAVGEAGGAAGPSACPGLTGGWTEYKPTRKIQFQGGDSFCTYRDEGGVEFFRMMKNPVSQTQRCEARVANDYTSGVNQFEGDVRVNMGDATCVHQVFKFMMLNVYPKDGGTLTQHTGTFVTAPIFDRWIHVNTIHDVASGKAEVYVDCVKKVTMNAGSAQGPNGWYNKYGLYGINGVAPKGEVSQVEWRNVRYFRKP